MSILPISTIIPSIHQSLSSSYSASGGSMSAQLLHLNSKIFTFSLTIPSKLPPDLKTIRMGGGPRTYPGGVSKWQWKKMQAKKAKQLLKARLARERQIYEMRKRAELKAAVSELERPWEAIEKAPTLFSSSADEQLKVLADRFQKPGGFDLWSERDGPQLFRPDNGLPSTRFFPKGVVHSVKPYGVSEKMSDEVGEFGGLSLEEDSVMRENDEKIGLQRKRDFGGGVRSGFGSRNLEDVLEESGNREFTRGRIGKRGIRTKSLSDREVGFDRKINRRDTRLGYSVEDSESGVYNKSDFGSRDFEDVVQESQGGKVRKGKVGNRGVRRTFSSDTEVEFDRRINRSNGGSGYSAKDSYSRVNNLSDFGSRTLGDVVRESQGGQFRKGRMGNRGFRRKSLSDSGAGFDEKIDRSNSWSGYSGEDSYSGADNLSDFGSRTFKDAARESLSGKLTEGRIWKRGAVRKSLSDSKVGYHLTVGRNMV